MLRKAVVLNVLYHLKSAIDLCHYHVCCLWQCGEITSVRLARNYKGKSKGFGYVEFVDSVSLRCVPFVFLLLFTCHIFHHLVPLRKIKTEDNGLVVAVFKIEKKKSLSEAGV